MKKRIELYNKNIEYTLKISKRARRMRLSIYCDGNFVVTVPRFMSLDTAERFIVRKARWVIEKLEYFKRHSNRILIKADKKELFNYNNQALVLVLEKIGYFNKLYGFRFNRINIKNQKTRWGSCSRKGNLNFNYKIALLPERLADYIVVHELCHLQEFNHSSRFWKLVARAIPNYLELRRELSKSAVKFQ